MVVGVNKTTNTYGAERVFTPGHGYTWRGWMTYATSPTNVISTPGTYRTRREAVSAIKGQQP